MLFNNLYPEVQLDSYRSVYSTEGSSREQAQNQRLALDFHLPFLGSYSHFSVGLSQNWLSGQLTPNLDISPESQTLSYVGVHTDRFGALNIEAEKFVASISTLFRLTANYSKMETQMRVNGEQIDKDARVLALGFTLNTAFRGWPNITSTYAYNMYKTPNIADEGKYQSWESNIVLGYRWASVMYLKLEHLHTANVVQHKVSYSSVLNFSAQTESHRSFSVRVSVLNILDTRNFEIVYQDAYVHTRNNRLLCPRSYLLTFEYSF
jgi:hypothetical protein